jgi:hypothetical protein
MSIQESDRTARNIELYPSVFGGPEEQQVAEALVQPPSTPPSYEKDYNSEPVDQPEAVEGELITQSQPGFAPKAPTRSKLGTAARLVKATTPVGAIAEGINAAAGPVARAAETRETRKLNKENRLATDPNAARENRKSVRTKWIGGTLIAGMVVGGGVYLARDIIATPAKIFKSLEHIFDKTHTPSAEVIVQTAISHISLDHNLPLVDATGNASVVLKEHGTAATFSFSGNWHNATTQYNADLQLSLNDPKNNIKYSSIKNQDGSYSVVATYNPDAIQLKTIDPLDDTVPTHGPLTGDDAREGRASSDLAQATFENASIPVIANLVPDGIAYEIKSSETNTVQQIEALPIPQKEKIDVIDALKKMLAKPIFVHALIDSPSGTKAIPARDLNLIPIVSAKARTDFESQVYPNTSEHRKFLLSRDEVASAIGLSKETKQLRLNTTKTISLSPEAVNDLINIKGQKLVADESAPAPVANSKP